MAAPAALDDVLGEANALMGLVLITEARSAGAGFALACALRAALRAGRPVSRVGGRLGQAVGGVVGGQARLKLLSPTHALVSRPWWCAQPRHRATGQPR